MLRLTSSQKAYIAGIIDGEGCITIVRASISNGKYNHQLRVVITNTNYPLMMWLRDTIGYGSIATGKIKSENHKVCYRYYLSSLKARDLLKSVYSFLIIKKEQADIALEFCKTIRKQKDNKCGRNGLQTSLVNFRESLKDKINKVNSDSGGHKLSKSKNKGCELGELPAEKRDNPEPSNRLKDILI